jgi:hypothetical protein
MIPIHHGIVSQNNKLILDTPSRYLTQLSNLKGKRIELTLKEEKSQRSINQNSYYWGVVVTILGDFFGYEPEEMHTALRMKFLNKEPVCGLNTAESTTALNTTQFEDYLERIRRWAAIEYHIYVPLPNEAAA